MMDYRNLLDLKRGLTTLLLVTKVSWTELVVNVLLCKSIK